MTLVSPSQSNPGDTIEASDINDPVNQIAAVVNGNIDSTNISSVSGSKLQAGTVAASALDTNANVETRSYESQGNFIASGCVWSAISGLNGTMASGVVYINGKRVAISSIPSRTFTPSKDTYVSVDVNGIVGYSEVANGATAPNLPSNSVWTAKVTSGSTSITTIEDIRRLPPVLYQPKQRLSLFDHSPAVVSGSGYVNLSGAIGALNTDVFSIAGTHAKMRAFATIVRTGGHTNSVEVAIRNMANTETYFGGKLKVATTDTLISVLETGISVYASPVTRFDPAWGAKIDYRARIMNGDSTTNTQSAVNFWIEYWWD